MIRLWAPSSMPLATVSFTFVMTFSKLACAEIRRWKPDLI